LKYKLLSVLVGSAVLAGCASSVGVWDDREALLSEINTSCETNTKAYTEYSPVFDQASQGVLSVAQRQCDVVGEYQEIRKQHKDVQQFFAMHSELPKEEIIALLDANPEMKAKYTEYTKAQSKIFESNLELAIKLGVQGATMAKIAAENPTVIAEIEARRMIGSAIDQEENPLGFVIDEMQTRVGLITETNGLISAEQQYIKDMEAADKAIKARIGKEDDKA
jgi:hypothetical protein